MSHPRAARYTTLVNIPFSYTHASVHTHRLEDMGKQVARDDHPPRKTMHPPPPPPLLPVLPSASAVPERVAVPSRDTIPDIHIPHLKPGGEGVLGASPANAHATLGERSNSLISDASSTNASVSDDVTAAIMDDVDVVAEGLFDISGVDMQVEPRLVEDDEVVSDGSVELSSTDVDTDSEESRSGSETYLELGGPVTSDANMHEGLLSRRDVVRTYDSSCGTLSDGSAELDRLGTVCILSDEDNQEEVDGNRRKVLEAARRYLEGDGLDGLGVEMREGHWGADVDDALSLEELQIEADTISEMIDAAPIKEHMRRERVTILPDTPPLREETGSWREERKTRRRKRPPERVDTGVVSLSDTDESADEMAPRAECGKIESLRKRLARVTEELASMQMITAGNAADAETELGRGIAPGARGMLKGEVCRLRITVDHVARMSLECAYKIREEAERHR